MLLYMQAHQSCALHKVFDAQTEAKPCPTANTGVHASSDSRSVQENRAPAPDTLLHPIHTHTTVSCATNILLIGNKARKTLWVAEQGRCPSPCGRVTWREPAQAPPKKAGERFNCLAHPGAFHLHLVETFPPGL